MRSGGVPPDGIPSIDEPVYVSAEEADQALGDLLKDNSVVLGRIEWMMSPILISVNTR
ncbi:MAG: hypothetical protein ABEI54_02540 [Candidatus Bipolaricaulia bacterium]